MQDGGCFHLPQIVGVYIRTYLSVVKRQLTTFIDGVCVVVVLDRKVRLILSTSKDCLNVKTVKKVLTQIEVQMCTCVCVRVRAPTARGGGGRVLCIFHWVIWVRPVRPAVA